MNLTWTKAAARIDRLEGALALLSQAMHAINDLGAYAETDEEVDELVDIQRRLARIRRRYQERRRTP